MAALITSQSRIILAGNSLGDDQCIGGSFGCFHGVRMWILNYYKLLYGSTPGQSRRRPLIWNYATNGFQSSDYVAQVATKITRHNPTHLFLGGNINDTALGVNPATTLTNMTTYFASLPVACHFIVADDLCRGEMWPSPQAGNGAGTDANIDTNSANLQNLLTTTYPTRSTFLPWRTGIFGVQEALLNTPGPGSVVGALCRPDIGPTEHQNALGRYFMTLQAQGLITLAP